MRAIPALFVLLLAACQPSRPPAPPSEPGPAPERPKTEAPAPEAAATTERHEVTLTAGDGGKAVKQPDGSTRYTYGPIFMLGAIAKAPGPVFLRLEGIKATPGASAEFYLVDHIRGFDPLDYVGSFATIAGGGPAPTTHILEVNDFDVDGKHYKARSTLREQSAYMVAMVVKDGSVSVERFVLSTVAEAERDR